MHYFGVPKLQSIHSAHWNHNDVWECFEHFPNLLHVKRSKTCVSGLNALFRDTEVAKYSFYSIGTKMIFESVTEYFANLRHVKRWKTCVSSLNALFQGTEVVIHPINSIGPKMIFASVSEDFANLCHIKDAKLVSRA
jgi:acid stress-induced BolA-like protein IbaG/YrbA